MEQRKILGLVKLEALLLPVYGIYEGMDCWQEESVRKGTRDRKRISASANAE
ncbi:MAG: hypothetical protein ACLUOF_11925 [Ruminococcus sp.]